MKKLVIFLFGSVFFPISGWSWGEMAHAVIAQIAYQHLTPQAKSAVDNLTALQFHSRYSDNRFYHASIWPDVIKIKADITAFNTWHFINLPYALDGITPPPLAQENLIWAIRQSYQVVVSTKAHPDEKTWFLDFLVHFIGDIHQPLHCIDRYTSNFPRGDLGGLLVKIKYQTFNENLHQFWDSGAGLFDQNFRLRYRDIENSANQISQEYPESYFGNQSHVYNPQIWAEESYQLGKLAYDNIQSGNTLSMEYVKNSQTIAKKQMALAAYRLANLLNKAFSQDTDRFTINGLQAISYRP